MEKRTKRAQRDGSVDRLLSAAKALFVSKGYRATTLEQIASAAHLTKGAVYFHFGAKESVLITLLELAALELTPTAGATFTRDEVVALALEIGGEDCGVREHDLRVVFDGSNFLRRESGGRWSLK